MTGSAFNAEVVFLKDDVQFDGTPQVFDFRSPAHGRALRSHFCHVCGVTVGLSFERFPNVQAILAGAYDDPEWVRFDKHIFTESALPWVSYSEFMDVYDGHSIGEDGGTPVPVRQRTGH